MVIYIYQLLENFQLLGSLVEHTYHFGINKLLFPKSVIISSHTVIESTDWKPASSAIFGLPRRWEEVSKLEVLHSMHVHTGNYSETFGRRLNI